jgi:large subunit ribosomal protein L25
MSNEFVLNAAPRTVSGKAESRRMRRLENCIPAVIYGAGKDNAHITLKHNEIVKATENEAFYSHILTMNVDKKSEKVVVKAMQRHPYRQDILHMDFLRVRADEKIRMSVPIHFLNEDESVGVKQEGGVISHNLTEVEIDCLPKDLPEFIEVDVAALKLGESLHLSDIKLSKAVEIVALTQEEPNNEATISIHTPKVEVEPEPEEVEEGAEGEAAEGENAEDAKGNDSAGDDADKKDGDK